MPSIGPYSRPAVLAKLDGRTREAHLLRRVRAELVAHVGGNPSATQTALIERAAMLTLHVAMLDARMLKTGSMSEHDSKTYLAWSGSLSRALRDLGLKGAAAAPPTLADILRMPPAPARNTITAPAGMTLAAVDGAAGTVAPADAPEPPASFPEAASEGVAA
jgi:hypothetical protein